VALTTKAMDRRDQAPAMRYSEQDLIARHSCASIRQSEYAEQYCKTGMKNAPEEGRMTRHIQTVAAGVFALCSALIPETGLAQEVTLRVHSFLPPVANPMKHYVTPWAQKVEKESGGRIKVQVFPSMQLGGKAEQLLTQVRDGVVDVAWTLPGFTPGVMPKLEIFELPFLHRSTNATVRSLQEYVPKYMKKDFEPYHVLLVHCHAGALFMTKDPINKVEDFQGMKLRAYSRTNAWILEALGAAPLQVALPELAPMLSKGTVSGAVLTYEIAPAVKMQDLVDYFTTFDGAQPRMGTTVFMFLMNKAKYESLPADLKKVIDDNSGRKLAPFAIQVWDMIDQDGLKAMQSKPKNKFVTLNAAETERFRKLVQPVFNRFKEEVDKGGSDGAKLIADAEALVEKYSK
jgi:TRAP-type C4-dicarboxylate transport system substrate-binding protein